MKKITKFMFAIIIGFVAIENVHAEVVLNLFNLYAQAEGESPNGNYKVMRTLSGQDDAEIMDIVIRGTEEHAFCVDLGVTLNAIDQNNHGYNNTTTLANYLAAGGLSSQKATEVAKKINEYLYFGWGYNGQSGYKYHLAVQKLIWDELYNAGYNTRHDSSTVSFYQKGDGVGIDVTTEMNKVKSNINNYYKTPSFCSSSSKLDLKINESTTYTDSNNVLSGYEVNCTGGIKCEKNGNNLKVTATSEGKNNKITFTKNGAGTGGVLYTKTNFQGVITNHGKVEPVTCTFGIDTHKEIIPENPKTGTIAIVFAWITGLVAIGFSVFYFKKTF